MKQIAMAAIVLLSLSACHQHAGHEGHDHPDGAHDAPEHEMNDTRLLGDTTQESFSVEPNTPNSLPPKQ